MSDDYSQKNKLNELAIDWDVELAKNKTELAACSFSYDELLGYAACMMIAADRFLKSNPETLSLQEAKALSFIKGIESERKGRARLNANKSHADTNTMKLEIIEKYCCEKAGFKNKDEAASAYTKEYPLAFSTIRKYLKNK